MRSMASSDTRGPRAHAGHRAPPTIRSLRPSRFTSTTRIGILATPSASSQASPATGRAPANTPIPPRPPGTVYPNAIYYCSQDIATAFCSRSDDGGSTYGPSVPLYTLLDCGGLHGHVKVSPKDGTVYVPNPDCGSPSTQALVVSTDNGVTWTVKPVPVSNPGGSGVGSDPAVHVDSNGRVYFLGVVDGSVAAVGTSDDLGSSWQNIFDVSSEFGLKQIAFPAAVAGDSGRAAVAFYGSTGTGEIMSLPPSRRLTSSKSRMSESI